MEVLGGSRAEAQAEVRLLHNFSVSQVVRRVLIVGITELQESFDTAGRVLGTSTIVAVRQEHDQARLDVPLGLGRSHELVDHDLGTVGEITKLSFPEDECRWVSLSVTELVTENGVLGQVRARSDELAGAVFLGDGVDGNVAAVTVLVEDVGVSMREGSSLDVLTADSDMVSFIDQRGESERLSSSPIDALARADGLVAGFEDFDDLWMEVAFGGQNSDFVSNVSQSSQVDTGVFHLTVPFWVLDLFPLNISPVLRVEVQVL